MEFFKKIFRDKTVEQRTNMLPILQVYSPRIGHDSSYIMGNKNGLLAMRDAIDKALESSHGIAHEGSVFVSDGDSFNLVIIKHDSDFQSNFWQQLIKPYTKDATVCCGVQQHVLEPKEIEHELGGEG